MKPSILRFSGAVVAALFALLCFGALVNGAAAEAATVPGGAVVNGDATRAEAPPSFIVARRAISIPFGIASPLALSSNGLHIAATGPAKCPAEGETYTLHVSVRQSDPAALARGRTKGVCGENDETWHADAIAAGPSVFAEGKAEVCAIVAVKLTQGMGTRRWCKTVDLVTGP